MACFSKFSDLNPSRSLIQRKLKKTIWLDYNTVNNVQKWTLAFLHSICIFTSLAVLFLFNFHTVKNISVLCLKEVFMNDAWHDESSERKEDIIFLNKLDIQKNILNVNMLKQVFFLLPCLFFFSVHANVQIMVDKHFNFCLKIWFKKLLSLPVLFQLPQKCTPKF